MKARIILMKYYVIGLLQIGQRGDHFPGSAYLDFSRYTHTRLYQLYRYLLRLGRSERQDFYHAMIYYLNITLALYKDTGSIYKLVNI